MGSDRRLFWADDWGFTPAINEAVVALARRRWLFAVSVVANSRYLRHLLPELLCHAEDIRLSLHLNLTQGRPVSRAADVATLVGRDGRFHGHRGLMLRWLAGRIDPEHARREFRSQLAVLRGLDLPVDHCDGHHHIHDFPPVARALAGEWRSAGIRFTRGMADRAHLPSFLQTKLTDVLTGSDRDVSRIGCDYLRPGDLRDERRFRAKVAALDSRALVIHPALRDDFAISGFRDALTGDRVEEFNTLIDRMGGFCV